MLTSNYMNEKKKFTTGSHDLFTLSGGSLLVTRLHRSDVPYKLSVDQRTDDLALL